MSRSGEGAPPHAGRATVRAPGTCGELAQGILDGEHFHITCPIDLYATSTVELVAGSGRAHGPADRPKSRRGVELTLALLGREDLDAKVSLANPLPLGKGMASSTADVVSAAWATASALGVQLAPDEAASLALQVEPSDGVMFPGIALFDHRQGRVLKLLGAAPAMRILVLDFGGMVDTLTFNAVDRGAELQRLEPHWREAATLVAEGVSSGNANLVGKGATVSALAQQQVLPKPQLDCVLAFAREVGAAGVNVAHSGTVLGVLFPDYPDQVARAAVWAWKRLTGLQVVRCQRLVSGGVALVTNDTNTGIGIGQFSLFTGGAQVADSGT